MQQEWFSAAPYEVGTRVCVLRFRDRQSAYEALGLGMVQVTPRDRPKLARSTDVVFECSISVVAGGLPRPMVNAYGLGQVKSVAPGSLIFVVRSPSY